MTNYLECYRLVNQRPQEPDGPHSSLRILAAISTANGQKISCVIWRATSAGPLLTIRCNVERVAHRSAGHPDGCRWHANDLVESLRRIFGNRHKTIKVLQVSYLGEVIEFG